MQNPSIALRHYDKLKPIICELISGDLNKIFTVKIADKETNSTNAVKGDPVLVGFLNDEELQIIGCNLIGITSEDTFIMCSDNVINVPQEAEKREFDRYPTSILGEAKNQDIGVREHIVIKNVSYSGICFYCDNEYEIEDILDITMYIGSTVSPCTCNGTVVRKGKIYGRNEYGLQVIYRDKSSMYAAQNFLTNVVKSERELIYKHLLNAKFKMR